jgi:citrate synthase
MESKIDYVLNDSDGTHMYINYNQFNSDAINWIPLDSLCADHDFIDILFIKLTGKKAESKERELLLKTLLLVSMGVGHEPPSVFIPKVIASTTKDKRFAMINGLIGGLAAFGTHHLGAVYDVMDMYKELRYVSVEKYVYRRLKNKEVIFGFGHPCYVKDPRPDLLLKGLHEYFKGNIYLEKYHQLAEILAKEKGISPNIDAIAALSYICLGFEPEHGTYLSFIARSLTMVCHISEEYPKKPFSFFMEQTERQK